VKRAISLVTQPGYAAIARQLGVDVVVPTKSTVVDEILSHLMPGSVKGLHSISDGSVDVIELELSERAVLCGKPITAFRLSGGSLVLMVRRAGISFLPRGDYVFESGDRVIIIAKRGCEKEIESFFGGKV
jgi:trk system potassium uptake protein TrkA